MKEQKPIDDFFKDRLHDFSLDAPMHIWDKMADMPLQPEAKKDRKKWLWLLLLLPVAGFGSYYFLQPSQLPRPEQNQIEVPTTTTTPAEAIVQNTDETTIEEIEATVEINRAIKEQNSRPNIALPQSSSSAEGNIAEISASKQSIPGPTSENTSQSEEIIDKATSESSTAAFEFVNETLSNQENPTLPDELQTAQNLQEQAAFQERIDLLLVDLLQSDIDLVPNPIGDEYMEPPVFKMKKPWETTVDIMSSMDFVMRQLEAKSSDFEDYARTRNNTETFRHGISVGMRLSTVSENGFAVRSGLNYSVINEQLNFKISEEERLTVTTRYGQDGSIIGQDTSLQLVGDYRIVNNRYTELDIPLLVGFERGGEKVSFSLNGGLLINMLSAQKGEFLSPEDNIDLESLFLL